jgi:Nif-specific ferredoxin III
MAVLTGLTQGKTEWIPKFAQSIDQSICLGCGRCFKACGRNVMTLIALNDEGEIVDEDDDDDEVERKVMQIIKAENCIGCEACARVCPKNCYTHSPLDLN